MRNLYLTDLANIGAGAYKGWFNAQGMEVDSSYLGYIWASTTSLNMLGKNLEVRRENNDPIRKMATTLTAAAFGKEAPPEKKPSVETLKMAGIGGVVNAVEIGIGYGLGYLASNVIN